MIVVKVGGSLFDLPDLRTRLVGFLGSLGDAKVLLVPGGGPAADVIRVLDRIHDFGEEASHWLAIHALSLNARFLQKLLPNSPVHSEPERLARDDGGAVILDAYSFFQADEARPDHLPHHWDVTSDSLAVRVAVLMKARELILLKSTEWEGFDWSKAAEAGLVDRYFVAALRQSLNLKVRLVDLRAF
jgi:aspartokinase-like uncharacterized kinase